MNALTELKNKFEEIEKSFDYIAYAKICIEQSSNDDSMMIWTHDMPIKDLNITYDNGYGEQKLFGYVVFKDGTWLERSEYDGEEWWEYKKTPSEKEVMGCGK